MTADHITRAEFLAALERVASAMPVRNPAVLQFTELLAAELRRENKAKKAAEPTGAAIAFGPVSKWDKLDSDLGCYCGETERCIRYRHDRWPALHASEAALRAEVERLRGIYDSAVAGRAKFRATLKAARDEIKQARAMLYVLIDEHGTDLSLAELIQRAEEDVNAEHDRAVQAEGTIVELRGNAEHDGRAFVVERHRAELLQAERDALRAARDRALAVLDAGHTAAYDLVADVREALKLP